MKYFGCGFEVGFLPYSLSTSQWCLCPEGRSVRLLAISSLHAGLGSRSFPCHSSCPNGILRLWFHQANLEWHSGRADWSWPRGHLTSPRPCSFLS